MSVLTRYRRWLRNLGDDLGLRISYTIDAIAHQDKIFLNAGDQISHSTTVFLKSAKTSNNLFILGSGASIRNLSKEDFDDFSSHDTLAFNFWMHSQFAPNFYILQRPKSDANAEKLWELARQRSHDYTNCKILLRGDGWKDSGEVEKFLETGFGERPALFLREWPVYSRARIDKRKLATFLRTAGYLSFGELGYFTPKFGSTLLLAVVLGFQMGYKNIILVGIDNDTGEYFYKGASDLRGPIFGKRAQTNQRRWLNFVNGYFKEVSDTKIWIYDGSNSLSSEFPTWKR